MQKNCAFPFEKWIPKNILEHHTLLDALGNTIHAGNGLQNVKPGQIPIREMDFKNIRSLGLGACARVTGACEEDPHPRVPVTRMLIHVIPVPMVCTAKRAKPHPNARLPIRWPAPPCSVRAVVARHPSPCSVSVV